MNWSVARHMQLGGAWGVGAGVICRKVRARKLWLKHL